MKNKGTDENTIQNKLLERRDIKNGFYFQDRRGNLQKSSKTNQLKNLSEKDIIKE